MESLAKLWARDIAANPIPQQKSWLVKDEITVHEAIPIHKPLSNTEDFRMSYHIPYINQPIHQAFSCVHSCLKAQNGSNWYLTQYN